MKPLVEGISLFLVLLAGLVTRVSPNPDEGQRILPGSSWAWQRSCLMASFPLAAILFLASLAGPVWAGMGLALAWASLGTYAGITTRWLRATRQAPRQARVAAGACVAVDWTLLVLSIALMVFYAVAIILIFLAAFVLGRDIIQDWLRRVR